ncbi:MAG: DUF3857 domain-containing protein, partial [Victivallales bacterium]|nr:DUF3857 domain-containing protein [Victivallales bacterium]
LIARTIDEADGRILYRWEVRNVPQAHRESAMPPLYACVQRLLVSTIPSWEEVSRWYWRLCEPHLKTTEEMEAKVRELVATAPTREARIRAIFRFVSQEIRYMGETTETEAPGYEPHDAAVTFGKRHGVCRDKAALLATLLRAAGFQAFPVLINASKALKDQEVPQPYFNHAITALLNDDGGYTMMDSTDEGTSALFPAYLSHNSYLVARPEGDVLRTSPTIPATDNLLTISTHGDIDANGRLTGFSSFVFHGVNDNGYRHYFAKHTPDERRIFLENILNRTLPGAKITRLSLSPEKLLDTEQTLTLELFYQAPQVIAGTRQTAVLKVPVFSSHLGMANFILGDASLDKRRFPYKCSMACGVHEQAEIAVSPAWGNLLSLPRTEEISRDTFLWRREYGWSQRSLSFTAAMEIRTVEFSPAEYLQLKEDMKTMEKASRGTPVFQPDRRDAGMYSALEPDAMILEEDSRISLTSPTEYTILTKVRQKILTYGGKKDYSELEFKFYPDFEKVSLKYAKVHNGDHCQELNLKETKLMDAPWVSSASRYPREAILVANLPGVEIGSVLEYEYETTVKNGAPFTLAEAFEGTLPIQEKSITLDAPEKLFLDCGVYPAGMLNPPGENPIDYQKTRKGDRIVQTWKVSERAPVPSESGMPRLRMFLPSIVLSTVDWKSAAGQLNRALQERGGIDDRLKKAVEQLGGMETLRQLRAVRNLVATRIRSAGPSHVHLPLSALTEAAQTFRDGYGNSADRAILYHALLRHLGYRPEFVFAASAPLPARVSKALSSHADLSLFPVVLVKVKAGGRTVWFNDIDQYAELGTSSHEGCPILLPNGKITILEVDKPFRTKDEVATDIEILNPQGDALLTRTILCRGLDFAAHNRQYSELTPEERRRHYLKLLNSLSASAVEEKPLETDFRNYPGVIRFAARIPGYASLQDNLLALNIPSQVPGVLTASGSERRNPYQGGTL